MNLTKKMVSKIYQTKWINWSTLNLRISILQKTLVELDDDNNTQKG